jgi:glucans biosynthesis protein
MQASRRCGAKTRAGSPCRAPAVVGKARCRMHGGAAGSGAPRGNTNARKHGWYAAATRAALRELTATIRRMEEALDDELDG